VHLGVRLECDDAAVWPCGTRGVDRHEAEVRPALEDGPSLGDRLGQQADERAVATLEQLAHVVELRQGRAAQADPVDLEAEALERTAHDRREPVHHCTEPGPARETRSPLQRVQCRELPVHEPIDPSR
jgi:hypothetical protein